MHEAGVKNDLSHNPHLYYADKYTMMPMYLVHEAYENLWLDVNKCLNLTSLIPCWSWSKKQNKAQIGRGEVAIICILSQLYTC